MQAPVDSAPPVAPSHRFGVIEVDTFCTGCHYNLHGQVVTVDERLGFPICQCPECGKFHPAGVGVTASGIWTRRAATILLFVWICIVIAAIGAMTAAMGGLDAASVGVYTYGYTASADGTPAIYQPSNTGGGYVLTNTHQPVGHVQYFQGIHPWHGDTGEYAPGWIPIVILSTCSLCLGFILASLNATLLWHWPRWRYLYAMILCLLPAAIASITFITGTEYQFIRRQCLERVACQTSFQGAGIVIGIFLGRPLARLIVRMIIPPKPRQALAYLWTVDGKKPAVLSV